MFTLIIAGACIGFVIGVTGVGGGSLMTPFLLWYGIPAHVAVGTDLLYAAITKSSGIVAHQKQGHISWRAVVALASTSIPGSLITLLLLQFLFTDADEYASVIKLSLGIMLFITGAFLGLRLVWLTPTIEVSVSQHNLNKQQYTKLILLGFPLGMLVTLSSVGAGVIGTMLLMIVLPLMPARYIVGTDLAHAVPLTFVAGIGHFLLLGNLDWSLLSSLLLGSLPAVYIGSLWSRYIPELWLKTLLSICLIAIGLTYLVQYTQSV